jgi:hypothetical protein
VVGFRLIGVAPRELAQRLIDAIQLPMYPAIIEAPLVLAGQLARS